MVACGKACQKAVVSWMLLPHGIDSSGPAADAGAHGDYGAWVSYDA
tara:strand:+ start:3087 stop:3224 length:138 start_codon:yes stop_codon:yes gene_type:complete